MSDRRQPRPPLAGNAALAWAGAGVVLAAFACWGMSWVAAQLAAPAGFVVPGLSASLAGLEQHGLAGVIGPHGSRVIFVLVLGAELLASVILAALAAVWWVRHRPDQPGRARMSRAAAVPAMREAAVRDEASRLRPSLTDKQARQAEPHQIGHLLGDVGGTPVYASFEDVCLAIFGPRSNKTSAVIVPLILSAPGHCVVTSNKPDAYALTVKARAGVGPVYVCDVGRVAFAAQDFWFDPLAEVHGLSEANTTATAIMREAGQPEKMSSGDRHWWSGARNILENYLLAAALTGKTMRDVLSWSFHRSKEPIGLLRGLDPTTCPDAVTAADSLAGAYQLARETLQSYFGNLEDALEAFKPESVLRWVTPPDTWLGTVPETGSVRKLSVWELVTPPTQAGPLTLYLLSEESTGEGRAVMTLLTDQITQTAKRAAAAQGGRLDPPLTLALDEAANTIRLDLPGLYSYAGSCGILVTSVLQSREQGRAAFGRDGFEKMWGAANHALVGAGIRDPGFCDEVSRLAGHELVDRHSATSSHDRGGSTSVSQQWEPVLRAEDIAAQPKTHAILLTQQSKPVFLRLHPWYREADSGDLAADAAEAEHDITAAAIAYLGPDNPLVRALQPPVELSKDST